MLKIRKLWAQYRPAPAEYKIDTPIDELSEVIESFNFPSPPAIYENMYAYILTLPGSSPPQAGRFRVLLYEVEYDGTYHISATCEQWKGSWVHTFQLIDEYKNPDAAMLKMEDMMKVFLTGKQSSPNSDYTPYPTKKRRPVKPKINKWNIDKLDHIIKKSNPKEDIKSLREDGESEPDDKDSKDDDFDWI